jgi:pimeloyl-ACP methyl ester carboxylesterase
MMTLVNGRKMAYKDEGKGPALLFIHGFPLNRESWSKQVDGLSASHRVIVPDLSGFGASEAGPGMTSMKGFAEDLFSLCQQLQTGPVVVVGHSMGGYIALAFAKAYPMFLSGLVLVSTKAGADSPEAAQTRRETAKKVQAEGIGSVVEAMAPKMLAATNSDQHMAQAVLDIMWSASPKGVENALLGMAARPDEREHLQGIQVPTLVVTGADDTIVPPQESVTMADAIPDAHLVVIPHAGHLVAFEHSIAFNAALKSWLVAHRPSAMAWSSLNPTQP